VDFEWDDAKERHNMKSHGVDFSNAALTFEDRHAFFHFDGRHSLAEDRFRLLGKTPAGQLLMTVFTWRGTRIRIISSRRAGRREAAEYEERVRLQ